jgi:ribosomal protein S18 acetylase RimI-like enzyme
MPVTYAYAPARPAAASQLPEPKNLPAAFELPETPKLTGAAVRRANRTDLAALIRIENRCFALDRFSARTIRYLVTKGHVATLIAERDRNPVGYAMVAFHARTRLARLYAFAVEPFARRQGIGRTLLAACERTARDRARLVLRLEVRQDNAAAIAFYGQAGFRPFGWLEDYYEDHAPALRMEKSLAGVPAPDNCPPERRHRRAL